MMVGYKILMTDRVKKVIKDILPYGMMKDKRNPDNYFVQGISDISPTVYDVNGNKYHRYYLDDMVSSSTPYSLVEHVYPRHILWDRFNRALPEHFYIHTSIKSTSGLCRTKYAIMRESEGFLPKMYDWVMTHEGEMREFDTIFTHSERILNKYANSKYAIANGIWYGVKSTEEEVLKNISAGKSKDVCMIASNKTISKTHRDRLELAKYCERTAEIDVYGTAVNRPIDTKDAVLNEYRYSIAIENNSTPYYFTEKILDCFASKTVPIYYGATEIGNWFNTDGIIQIKKDDFSNIESIVTQCSEKDYLDRADAIEDNYQRVKKFDCIENYLTDNYGI